MKARHAPAAVEHVLLTAGPGRMRLRVDVEMQRVARLAPGAPGGEFGAVGHHHLDEVIIGMGIGFHRFNLCRRRQGACLSGKIWRLYSAEEASRQAAGAPPGLSRLFRPLGPAPIETSRRTLRDGRQRGIVRPAA